MSDEMRTKSFEEGGYIYIDTPTMQGWHKCTTHKEFFANHDAYDESLDQDLLKWIGPKVPVDITKKLMALSAIRPHTEVMVVLYFNPTDRTWLPHVPKQYGTAAHVDYDDEDYEPPQGYVFFGTVHTHPNMGAFWSGTDRKDQKGKPGLHVVLGLREGKIHDIKATLFYNGADYDQPKDVLEMPEEGYEVEDPPADWVTALEQEWRPPVRTVQTCLTGLNIYQYPHSGTQGTYHYSSAYNSYRHSPYEHLESSDHFERSSIWDSDWCESEDEKYYKDLKFGFTEADKAAVFEAFFQLFLKLSPVEQYQQLAGLADEVNDIELENLLTAKLTEMEIAMDKAEEAYYEELEKDCFIEELSQND